MASLDSPAEEPSPEAVRWSVITSVGFFLVPILLAIVGAVLGQGYPAWQLVGAVAGLATGAGLAWLTTGWLCRPR
jgi:hypothetical protein